MSWLTFMALIVLVAGSRGFDPDYRPISDDDLPPLDAALYDSEEVLREGRETPVDAEPPASDHVVSLRIRADVAANGERAFWVEAIGTDGGGACIIEAPSLDELMVLTEGLVDLGDPRLTFDRGATM